jgi:hypothetical protein
VQMGKEAGDRNAKKTRTLQMPQENLTKLHSTCILPPELSLDRKN